MNELDQLKEDNAILRRLLATYAGAPSMYTDDGELQDNATHPTIDFLRDSAKDIEANLQERNRNGFWKHKYDMEWEHTNGPVKLDLDTHDGVIIDCKSAEVRLVVTGHDWSIDSLYAAGIANKLNKTKPIDMNRLSAMSAELENLLTALKNASYECGMNQAAEYTDGEIYSLLYHKQVATERRLRQFLYNILGTSPFAISHIQTTDPKYQAVCEFAEMCFECLRLERRNSDWATAVHALVNKLSAMPSQMVIGCQAEQDAFAKTATVNNYKLGSAGAITGAPTETQDFRFGWISALLFARSLFPLLE